MMSGRPKEPIEVLQAKGKKHLTKDEIAEREASEIKVPFKDIKAPKYLRTKKLRDQFYYYASKLETLNIFTELDVDILGRYIIASDMYLTYTAELEKINKKISKDNKWAVVSALAEQCDEEGSTLDDLIELLKRILRRQRGSDATVYMNLQSKAFSQCMACARELGLSVSARCKLVVPGDPEDDDEL